MWPGVSRDLHGTRPRWLDDGFALVQVRFPYFDADGNDLGDAERSLYLLRRQPNREYLIAGIVALGTESDRQMRRRRRPVGDVGDQRA